MITSNVPRCFFSAVGVCAAICAVIPPNRPVEAARIVVNSPPGPLPVATLKQKDVLADITLPANSLIRTFNAQLNGRNITQQFTLSGQTATAHLGSMGELRVQRKDELPITGLNWMQINIYIVTAQRRNEPLKTEKLSINRLFYVLPDDGPIESIEIGPEGGGLELPEIAVITVLAGSLSDTVDVTVQQTEEPLIEERWGFDQTLYDANIRHPKEIRIRAGTKQPIGTFIVDLTIPDDLRSILLPTDEIRVFVQNIFDGSPDGLSNPFPTIRLLQERVPFDAQFITVELDPAAFSELGNPDGEFEAVLFLGATPTARASLTAVTHKIIPIPDIIGSRDFQLEIRNTTGAYDANIPASDLISASADGCRGTSLQKPFDGDFPISSPWGPRVHPIKGTVSNHAGVDYAMPELTPVLSAGDGKVRSIKNDSTGYGYYMDIVHTDGSVTRYAHLTTNSALKAEGQSVTAGTQIALSGNTGGSTGPHLHFEYRPNGKLYGFDGTVDPVPCLDRQISGSITVRDNGNVADDAFSVAINGLTVCTTDIGAANTCAVGNLRPGTAVLTITIAIAPDDIGTYEITLGEGLTFADGTTSRSGSPPQGTSVNYDIIIPSSTTMP